MTWPDLAFNLGTIARSRTKDFMEAFAAGADVTRIGQFGFGFYFAFLVAGKLWSEPDTPMMCSMCVWKTHDGGSFTVTMDAYPLNLVRGSKMTLYLKEDQLEYLEEGRLKDLIIKHSALSRYPISLAITKFSELEIPDVLSWLYL